MTTPYRPSSGWFDAAHQLLDDRPSLAGVGLTDALDLIVSAA